MTIRLSVVPYLIIVVELLCLAISFAFRRGITGESAAVLAPAQ